jgi:hypothetical protein
MRARIIIQKRDAPPTGMRTSVGATPELEIVIVTSPVEGEDGLLPHAVAPRSTAAAANGRSVDEKTRRIMAEAYRPSRLAARGSR